MVHLLNEIAQHLLGDVEIGDHAVLQRTNRADVRRGSADHALGLGTDREDRAGHGVHGDDRGLVQDDAAAADVDKGVRRPQVHGHVPSEEAGDPFGLRGGLGRHALEPALAH